MGLEDEYKRQLRILEGKEDTHVAENEHCPPKLEEAKEELAKQEAIPNDTAEDVEAECRATKAVLKWQKCVDELEEAQIVLAKERMASLERRLRKAMPRRRCLPR